MAKTSSKELIAARRRRAELRTHYRRFLETRDGRPYNPLLDNPGDPRNLRSLSHGGRDGYDLGGCRCDPCDEAGRGANRAMTERRIARRLDEHKAAIAEVLAARFPALPEEDVQAAAAKVIAIGKVVNKTKARVDYPRVDVVLALDNWALRGGHVIHVDVIEDLADALTERIGQ